MADLLLKSEWERLPEPEKPDGHIRYLHKDGRVLAITEGVTTFDELAEKRANPPPEPAAELADIKARLAKLEATAARGVK